MQMVARAVTELTAARVNRRRKIRDPLFLTAQGALSGRVKGGGGACT